MMQWSGDIIHFYNDHGKLWKFENSSDDNLAKLQQLFQNLMTHFGIEPVQES